MRMLYFKRKGFRADGRSDRLNELPGNKLIRELIVGNQLHDKL